MEQEKGKVHYDENGKPICSICGKSFDRLLTHVRQKHFMTEREYKEMNGLDVGTGIISKESKQKSRDAVFRNYNKVVAKNLIMAGESTRYKAGHEGRTKDMVSEQTKKRLIERLKTPRMQEAMKLNGVRLGVSGIGNKKRWGNG
jgi:hypothetical protein